MEAENDLMWTNALEERAVEEQRPRDGWAMISWKHSVCDGKEVEN